MEKYRTEKKEKWWKLTEDDIISFLLTALAVTASFKAISYYKETFPGGLSDSHQRWAEFGSYIGGTLGSLFAFLAFIVLLRTLYVNQKELAETRKVLSAQNSLLKQQSFEATFMQLLQQIDVEFSLIKIDLDKKAVSELAHDIEMRIIACQDDEDLRMLQYIDELLHNELIFYVIEKYLGFLKIILDFIFENIESESAKKLHLKLFANKLQDDFLPILLAYILVNNEDFKLQENMSKYSVTELLDDKELIERFNLLVRKAEDFREVQKF